MDQQRKLFANIETSEEAYSRAVEDCDLGEAATKVAKWVFQPWPSLPE